MFIKLWWGDKALLPVQHLPKVDSSTLFLFICSIYFLEQATNRQKVIVELPKIKLFEKDTCNIHFKFKTAIKITTSEGNKIIGTVHLYKFLKSNINKFWSIFWFRFLVRKQRRDYLFANSEREKPLVPFTGRAFEVGIRFEVWFGNL